MACSFMKPSATLNSSTRAMLVICTIYIIAKSPDQKMERMLVRVGLGKFPLWQSTWRCKYLLQSEPTLSATSDRLFCHLGIKSDGASIFKQIYLTCKMLKRQCTRWREWVGREGEQMFISICHNRCEAVDPQQPHMKVRNQGSVVVITPQCQEMLQLNHTQLMMNRVKMMSANPWSIPWKVIPAHHRLYWSCKREYSYTLYG